MISYYITLIMNTYSINLKLSTKPITEEHFLQLCTLNPELRLETNGKGELIVMSPTPKRNGKKKF